MTDERDAFGNPIPDRRPAVVIGGALPVIPTYGKSRASVGEQVARLLVVLLFVGPFALGGWIAWNAFHTAKVVIPIVKSVRDLAPKTPVAPHQAATPVGVAGASMLRAANLERALKAARRDPGGGLALVRVAPERVDLQLAPKHGGGLDLVQVRADGGRSVVRTPGSVGTARMFRFAQVDTEAPARLVRRAAKRLGRSTKAIDYVVLVDGIGWSAYFQGGAAFQGDTHGRVTRRIQ